MATGQWAVFAISWLFVIGLFLLWNRSERELAKSRDVICKMFMTIKAIYENDPKVVADNVPEGMIELLNMDL